MQPDPSTRTLVLGLNALMVIMVVGLIVGYIVAKA
jgi:hypothetical protein